MTKNQKIKRLENIVRKLADALGFSVSFYDNEEKVDLNWQSWNPPIRGWKDPRIQALLKHLGIRGIEELMAKPMEYKVFLIRK